MAEAKMAQTTEEAAVKKTAKKATAKKAETKTTAAKTAAKKTTTTRTRKAAVKETISIQFAGREYTTEQLVKSAKDVWEFDLKKDPADVKEIQLYVKPEEAKAYFVINGEESGSFEI